MEGNVAAAYALIYRFLKAQSQTKAAEAVKKAAKSIVVLRDDVEQKGPPLEDIIKEWQTKKGATSKDADSSSESSESTEDSSSNSKDGTSAGSSSEDTSESEDDDDTSDSDESDDDSDKGVKAKKLPIKSAERDTSVTLSSAGGNSREATKKAVQIPEKKSTRDESEDSESDSSESDSSSNSSAASDGSDAEVSSGSSDSSSSSDSSDEDQASANANKKTPQNKATTSEDESSSSSESSSDSESESDPESGQKEDVRVTKKRKTSEGGAAVTTAVDTGSERVTPPSQKRANPPVKVRERFQRVKVKNLAPELLLDNGYKARGGVSNDYGERAHHDLIVTRGAGFRKEKNKKKRGSYRGGEITMESRSIKFDF